MTKSELIEVVAEKLKLPKGRAELIVNCIFDSMEAALRDGDRIEIRGFGSFEVRHYKSYEGRNPRTGSKVGVEPKRLPFFKVGKELKDRVNGAPAVHGLGQAPALATVSAARSPLASPVLAARGPSDGLSPLRHDDLPEAD